ncbi:hypothetical protein D9M72_147690 [compost metagenome]
MLCNCSTRPWTSAIARWLEVWASARASACADALSWACPADRRTRSCGGAAVATPVSPGRATLPDAPPCPCTTDGLAADAAPIRERYLAKASACSLKIRRASAGSTARTVAASGIVRVFPARTRFILFWMNASGFARHSATSIWYTEALGTAFRCAMPNRLSPDFTLTDRLPPAREGVPTEAGVTSALVPSSGTRMLTCTCRWPELELMSSSKSTAPLAGGCEARTRRFLRVASMPSSMRTTRLANGTGGFRPARSQAASSATETFSDDTSSGLSSCNPTTACSGAPGTETTRECPTRMAIAEPHTLEPIANAIAHCRAFKRRACFTWRERWVISWNSVLVVELRAGAGSRPTGGNRHQFTGKV